MGIFILLALITPLFLQHIKAAEFSAVDVNITYQYDSENSSSSVLADKVYGSYVDFQPAVNPSYNFAVWVVNGVVRPDLPENASIKVTSNMNIIGLYAPVGEYGVLFIDTNGQIIDRQYVVSGGTAVPPTNALPNKPGLEIKADAWVSDQGLITFDNVLENRIYTLQYQSSSSDTYDLYIDNVLYSAYPYNELVTVTADASVEGVPFAYWALNGYAVSCDLSYTFTMLEDMNLTKVYENDFESGPMLVMSSDLAIRSGYQSFMAQFYLPEGYELVEWGFIYSNDNTADLAIGAEGVVQAQSNQYNPASNEYLMSFSLGFLDAISAYMFYDDGSSIHVMYSDLTARYVVSNLYYTGAENATKPSYDDTTNGNSVDLDGISWTLYDSVIGSLANDKYFDTKGIRVRDGYIKSDTAFNNLTEFSFYAAYYGTESDSTIKVEVSSDNTTWVDVTDSISSTLNSSLTEYIVDLSESATYMASAINDVQTLYVKISRVGAFEDRMNIDDFSIPGSQDLAYKVSFISDEALYDSEMVIENGNANDFIPIKEGYTFIDWYSDSSFTAPFDFETIITQDIALFGQWSINQYTVSFDSNGGSAVTSITDDYGTDISSFFEEPTKTGYNFTGWYSDSELTKLYTFDTIPGSDITIYAGWSPIEYSITYNLDGGLNHELNPATYTIEDEVNLLAASKDGYVFAGWYDAAVSGEEVTLITNQTGDVTLYAYWTVASGTTYVVSFDSNGGSSVVSQTINEGEYAIEPTNPTATNYVFNGWYTESSLTNLYDFNTQINNNITLYAGWIETSNSLIIYEVYGGGGNSGATYKNDFIVLFNGTSSTIDLNGYSIQYTSATGTSWSNITQLSGSIASGAFYVIQEAAGSGGTLDLPQVDTTGAINLSGTKGKVALVNSSIALSGANPSSDPSVIDFVGFGTANGFETAASIAPSNTSSIRRNDFIDTNDNSTDFSSNSQDNFFDFLVE